ncbi:MAG: hypothetical protein HY711_08020 [Candidatus Melainabacteria bacterium]|nr:hypothetical protein [Candidatus Melainabacteria bacterium]
MKVRNAYKIAAFGCSVVALSWCFAGYRGVTASFTEANWILLVGGIVLTLMLVGVQAYWIYFEEKSKGKLRKRIHVFEQIYAAIKSDKSPVQSARGEPNHE